MTPKERIKMYEETLERLHKKRSNVELSIKRLDERIKHNKDAINNLEIKNSKIEYNRSMNPSKRTQC